MSNTVKMIVVICVVLAICWLLASCTNQLACDGGGVPIHYYEIDTCFWPEPPSVPR